MDESDEAAFKLSDNDRAAAHHALDRWLDECEREASDAFESGHAGYIGRIKLCAFESDDGISLRIERSFTRDL